MPRLHVTGPGANGAGVTVGDRVTLAARATGCGQAAQLEVLRVAVKQGRHAGPTTRRTCANPCQIHDRRTKPGGYDYQVVVRVGSKIVRSGS